MLTYAGGVTGEGEGVEASLPVAGEQRASERAVAPDAAAARYSVCLLYWYKSANTDT